MDYNDQLEDTQVHEPNRRDSSSRREFLKASTLAVPAMAYAAGSDTIRIGLIGCGGRNNEAAGQALTADKGNRLVAMSDIAIDRVQERRTQLKLKFRSEERRVG